MKSCCARAIPSCSVRLITWVNRSDKHCRLFIVMVAGRITPELEKIIGAMPAWEEHRAGR